jgi:hypothetical protein
MMPATVTVRCLSDDSTRGTRGMFPPGSLVYEAMHRLAPGDVATIETPLGPFVYERVA